MVARIEKILCTILNEADKWQIEETMAVVLSEGLEDFYISPY
jgi:hypothetical protein